MAIITLTKDNFEETITQNEIVLIDFWAEWCGPCKSFAPIYENVSKTHPTIIFAKVDIDSETELAQSFQVRSIPLLAVIKDKVVIFSEAGVLPQSALENLVQQAIDVDMQAVKKQIQEDIKKEEGDDKS